jgi:ADP-heptose:LPS heptosyltransferase
LDLYSLDTPEKQPRILIIRRDNIGDLVCTTPLIRALREQLPDAYIAALVTRYNMAVMEGNPDIDALFSYTKAKHLEPGESALGIFWSRLVTICNLRRQRFDWILLPGGPQRSAMRFARWIGAKKILIRDQEDTAGGSHHVEQCCHQLVRMGLKFETPSAQLTPNPDAVVKIKSTLPLDWQALQGPVIALHLSARKPSQRWPASKFSETAHKLHEALGAKFILLWSPGAANNPLHPGDDEKAAEVLKLTAGLPVQAVRTERLEGLIGALSHCEAIICSDGGAMHLAAALGRPMVCLFGDSDPQHWGPWKATHRTLQKPSREVADISVQEVTTALLDLIGKS